MCFEIRAPSSTSLPSRRRISNPLTCPPRTPTQGTSIEDFGANTTGSTELLSQPIQPPPRQYKHHRPRLTVDRSVDRPHPRVGYLQSVDRSVDRPKWLTKRARFVHVGQPVRSTDSGPGRPPEPGRRLFGTEKFSFKIF